MRLGTWINCHFLTFGFSEIFILINTLLFQHQGLFYASLTLTCYSFTSSDFLANHLPLLLFFRCFYQNIKPKNSQFVSFIFLLRLLVVFFWLLSVPRRHDWTKLGSSAFLLFSPSIWLLRSTLVGFLMARNVSGLRPRLLRGCIFPRVSFFFMKISV